MKILKVKSTTYILHQLRKVKYVKSVDAMETSRTVRLHLQVIEMRKSGAVGRRDDMIDLMIDTIQEEEKYRESVRTGKANNNVVRSDILY